MKSDDKLTQQPVPKQGVFERWAEARGYKITKHSEEKILEYGEYVSGETQAAWEWWRGETGRVTQQHTGICGRHKPGDELSEIEEEYQKLRHKMIRYGNFHPDTKTDLARLVYKLPVAGYGEIDTLAMLVERYRALRLPMVESYIDDCRGAFEKWDINRIRDDISEAFVIFRAGWNARSPEQEYSNQEEKK